ncbi:MAG: hypothetical protein P0119_06380 [Nitrospira sp.]|nr:hypothetical protein [Nitrospira sp.]
MRKTPETGSDQSLSGASGKVGWLALGVGLSGFQQFGVPHMRRILFLISWVTGHSLCVIEATLMRLNWMNGLLCLLTICLMSGLVACGSLASCFNSGFAPIACGGGYGESDVSSLPQPTATSAEGRWTGATPTGRIVTGLVLDDGSYWVFYTARGNPNFLAGLVQGTGTSHSSSFGSSNTRDFNVEGGGIRAATMRGTYVPNKSFHGTITYFNGDTENFTRTYDGDSELAPNLNLVAGTYAGLRTDNHTVTVTVDSAGTLSGHSSDGCTVAGTLSPRATGNVFHASVTFGGSACRDGTETVRGVAFYDAATDRLYGAALNRARTNSFIFFGTKR